MATRNTREHPLSEPSEMPTRPRLRLPQLALPAALPAVPWIAPWAEGDDGRATPGGGRPEASIAARYREVWHGGR